MGIKKKIIYPFVFVAFLVTIAVTIAGAASVPKGKVKPVGHFGGFIDAVDVIGNYAYIGQGQDLVILDIANPSSPVSVGRIMTKNLISGVKISGNYAYVASGDNGLVIIDVSNPSSPVLKGSYDTPGYASSIAISGSYAM
ncbi:LVIVD repeat-containing protein [Methanosarcina barkeri]|uniref:LVIVD repeat-containing protein n=1 Tax=Methanosarcina barkeri TaxID=2208 RepID=UPI0006CFAE5D|nr:hypothetical protein [Methanosarcina barkeri]